MAKKTDYFEMFIEMTEVSSKAVEQLGIFLKNFDSNTLPEHLDEMHQIEFAGDQYKHQILEKVSRDFITPIEREDILSLVDEIDDVIDNVEDVLIKIYMYNITQIKPEAIEFIQLVKDCCNMLLNVMKEFVNFRKSKTIAGSIIEINRLEELGDKLYIEAIHTLYVEKGDPLETIAWTEVYNSFEKCCDTCEHAADVVSNVMMKNT